MAKTAVAEGVACPFLGSGGYTSCQIILRVKQGYQLSHMTAATFHLWRGRQGGGLSKQIEQIVENLSSSRPNEFECAPMAPAIVGILNITPDSFSDGGEYIHLQSAVRCAVEMIENGAAVIDVGGESTRPGAKPISSKVEQERVLPVLEALLRKEIPLSIDTYHPDTMQAASALGVGMLNDISGFAACHDSLKIAAASGKVLVLVHSTSIGPRLSDEFDGAVAIKVFDDLYERIQRLENRGVARNSIVIDPGLGFGKSSSANFKLLRWLSLLHGLGCQVMLGASRKFGRLKKERSPKDRLAGSIATAIYGAQQGVQLLRVHDVAETCQALGVWKVMGKDV
ncbi:MAG: dihydropteroate synthase [Pseudomonadota bacterium]|nr:dihydropteroate synthase [Pseudomonadota bacterium]